MTDKILTGYLIFIGGAAAIAICSGLFMVIKSIIEVSSKDYKEPIGNFRMEIHNNFEDQTLKSISRDVRRQKELAELARNDRMTEIDRWKK